MKIHLRLLFESPLTNPTGQGVFFYLDSLKRWCHTFGMKIDMTSMNPANSAIGGSILMAGMTADHGNPLINAAVGAGVGAAVGVGARIKQARDKKQANRHHVTSDTQFGKVK